MKMKNIEELKKNFKTRDFDQNILKRKFLIIRAKRLLRKFHKKKG
jgi:hypothetical protein